MKVNPRHFVYQDARIKFTKLWLNFVEEHNELTTAELLSILGSELQSMINISVQQEWKEARRELRDSESGGQEDGGRRPSS